MGMYTGLRVVAKIKPEYKGLVDMVTVGYWDEVHENGCWYTTAKKYPFLREFAEMDRSSFIPYGALCYMPEDWNKYNEWDGTNWEFSCSLKNYNGEIHVFMEQVLTKIATTAKVEYLYEEMSSPDVYQIQDGKVEKIVVGRLWWADDE